MAEKKMWRLVNLVWRRRGVHAHRVALDRKCSIDVREVEAVILFPAFLTPGVVCDPKERFEILLATSGDITPRIVNEQLRWTEELGKRKRVRKAPLYAGNPDGKIEVRKIQEGLHGLLDTTKDKKGRFIGIIHPSFKKALNDSGLKSYWSVFIDQECLARGSPDGDNPRPREDVQEFHDILIEEMRNRLQTPNFGAKKAAPGPIKKDRPAVPGAGVNCFAVPSETGKVGLIPEAGNPVVALHPLFIFQGEKDLEWANIGHVSDIHINARQQIMRQSRARVIDVPPDQASGGEVANLSPEIGGMVNVCSDNFASILTRLADPSKRRPWPPLKPGEKAPPHLRDPMHVLLVGGDLIDHVPNVFENPAASKKKGEQVTVGEIWDRLSLDPGTYYEKFVDHVAFYSVMRWFLEKHGVPSFVVSGNHDAYTDPFGISPLHGNANQGIPADHNLTFYEARLAFGDTWSNAGPGSGGLTGLTSGVLEKGFGQAWEQVGRLGRPLAQMGNSALLYTFSRDKHGKGVTPEMVEKVKQVELKLGPSMDKENFEWFYTVFTPFSDFAVDLPRQRIMGLEWGDEEAMIFSNSWKLALLPRATQAVTEGGLALMQNPARDDAQRKVLFTHFTFASLQESLRDEVPGEGNVKGMSLSSDNASFGKKDMGTFEKRRDEVYALVTAPRQFQCVFTGHSHRKGLYVIDPPWDGNKVVTGDGIRLANDAHLFPFDTPFTDGRSRLERRVPIIVSDSAGPIPRKNVRGELGEWGSDWPSGTLVTFDAGGEAKPARIACVQCVRSDERRAKPRLAVSLDYLREAHLIFPGPDRIFQLSLDPRGVKVELVVTLGKDFDGVTFGGITLFRKEPAPSSEWRSWEFIGPPRIERSKASATIREVLKEGGIPKTRHRFWARDRDTPLPGAGSDGWFVSMACRPMEEDEMLQLRAESDLRRRVEVLKNYDSRSRWNLAVSPQYNRGDSPSDIVLLVIAKPNFGWLAANLPGYKATGQ